MNATQEDAPVEILDRKTLPGDVPCHAIMRFTMTHDGVMGQFRKTFPDQMPSTHRLAYRWYKNDRGQAVVEVGPEPIPAQPVTIPEGEPAPVLVVLTEEDERKRFEAMSIPELREIAGQRGVTFKPGMSKALLISALLEAAPKPA